ncbi:MAG: sigma-54-dependent Fis family transcriptional regulator [Thermincola sp.]|jgi:PAS domain S-box-containing protein|nr:sigma-54-dependent Fis family transcriptional regulator [Thermincola sp.]MDT3704215.1 sigma-54-dependent Fis family transcriptional regulator [Thermincola sp.]
MSMTARAKSVGCKVFNHSNLEIFLRKKVQIGVAILDDELTVLWANDIFKKWFGNLARQGQLCCNIHNRSCNSDSCPALKTFDVGKVEYDVVSGQNLQGEERAYRCTSVPIHDRNGVIIRAMVIFEDVTYNKVKPGSSHAIFCLDKEGRIISTNPDHLRIAEASSEKVIGLNWVEAPKSREVGLSDYLDRGLKGEPFELFNFRYLTYRGDKEHYANLTGVPLQRTDGQVEGLLCILEDATEKIREKGQCQIVGQSAAIKEVMNLASKVAVHSCPVLIGGESGTGKELVAQEIHKLSPRAQQPFVVINAAAFQDTLLESELFGHTRGSFTGADYDKPGLLELADNGTFFIDEIGEMSLAMQVKLLRVLETGIFRPVGSLKEVKVNVRIITATNRNLQAEVIKGNFRKDLYYRLNVVKVIMPPLRERKEDIPLLVQHFLQKFNTSSSVHQKRIPANTMERLLNYRWPGNVRELANVVENAAILSGEKIIRPEELHLETSEDESEALEVPRMGKLDEVIARCEQKYIYTVLKSCQGDKIKAAEILGISLRGLYRKIETYGFNDNF